jgi:hypothetical protein
MLKRLKQLVFFLIQLLTLRGDSFITEKAGEATKLAQSSFGFAEYLYLYDEACEFYLCMSLPVIIAFLFVVLYVFLKLIIGCGDKELFINHKISHHPI